jgi:hypothetical protein
MLKIVQDYGKEHEIKFNVNKTFLMLVDNQKKINNRRYHTKQINTIKLKLDEQTIPQTNIIKYLGSLINNKLKNDNHIDQKIRGQAIKVNQFSKIGFNESNISAYTKAFYFTVLRTW